MDKRFSIYLVHRKINRFTFCIFVQKYIKMKKEHVKLSPKHREQLLGMLGKGSLTARVYKRINALLALDDGLPYTVVKKRVHLSRVSLTKLAKKYKLSGLGCLYDNARSGRPIKIDAKQRDQVTLLACEETPDGHSHWSTRLLADKMVELGHCEDISHTSVHNILKKKT